MKHRKKNTNRKWIITVIVCVAVIVFGVIYLSATRLINLNPNFASPNKFVVADDFDVSINSTSIKYDEAESSDNILINLNVKNNSDAAYHLISCFFINASQDSSKILTEPNEDVRNDGIENNTTALGQVIDSGESMEMLFAFKLADYSDVRLSFTGFGLDDQPQEPIVVVMPVHKTFNVWWNEICKWWDVFFKQNAQSIKVANFDIPLVDGWYAETQGEVASVFKNPKFEGAQITMSASSSVSASDLAAQSVLIAGGNAQVQSFDIKGKTYYGFETQNGFVLCIEGEDNLALRIFGQGITLDQATPLLP